MQKNSRNSSILVTSQFIAAVKDLRGKKRQAILRNKIKCSSILTERRDSNIHFAER